MANPSQIKNRNRRIALGLNFLAQRFPAAFAAEKVNAFCIGIHEQMQEELKGETLPEGVTVSAIKQALYAYCNKYAYMKAKGKVGNPRVNLWGHVVGEVTEQEVLLHNMARKAKKQALAEKKKKAATANKAKQQQAKQVQEKKAVKKPIAAKKQAEKVVPNTPIIKKKKRRTLYVGAA